MLARTPWALTLAGALTWAVLMLSSGLSGSLGRATGGAAVDAALWVAFAGAFLGSTVGGGSRSGRLALVGVQTVVALALVAFEQPSAGVLLVVVAGQLPFFVRRGETVVLWLAAQALVQGLIADRIHGADGVFTVVATGAFAVFAASATWLARREAEARRAQALTYAELVATRSVLDDTSRAAERSRISRELHDAIGHHLAALSLQLELARARSRGEPAVASAQAIVREMLDEVRAVVSALRDDRGIDLRRALQRLAEPFPSPRVHVSVCPGVEFLADPARLHTLFRLVQECLTNAVRHAQATNVWVDITREGDTVVVGVRDDGRGTARIIRGHGLTGLEERLAALGGALHLDSKAGDGFRVRATLPGQGGVG